MRLIKGINDLSDSDSLVYFKLYESILAIIKLGMDIDYDFYVGLYKYINDNADKSWPVAWKDNYWSTVRLSQLQDLYDFMSNYDKYAADNSYIDSAEVKEIINNINQAWSDLRVVILNALREIIDTIRHDTEEDTIFSKDLDIKEARMYFNLYTKTKTFDTVMQNNDANIDQIFNGMLEIAKFY